MLQRMIILLLLTTTPLQAAIHRWVDENGKVHYSDSPPAQTQTDTIKLPPAPKVVQPAPKKAEDAEQERPPKEGEYFKDEAKKACDESKQRLEKAESEQQLFHRNSDGTRRYMSDEQKQEYLQKLRDNIKEYCL